MTNQQILAYLRAIESNNGQNFNHPVIKAGLDRGTQAAGNYGLTASTINDVIKNNPHYASLMAMNPQDKKSFIESHPQDEGNIADSLVGRLQQRYNGDPSKIAYAWNHGTYINPNAITPEKLANDQYTGKFNRLSQKLNGNTNPVKDNILAQTLPSEIDKSNGSFPSLNSDLVNSIVNDPNNPFNKKDDEDDEESQRNFYSNLI